MCVCLCASTHAGYMGGWKSRYKIKRWKIRIMRSKSGGEGGGGKEKWRNQGGMRGVLWCAVLCAAVKSRKEGIDMVDGGGAKGKRENGLMG